MQQKEKFFYSTTHHIQLMIGTRMERPTRIREESGNLYSNLCIQQLLLSSSLLLLLLLPFTNKQNKSSLKAIMIGWKEMKILHHFSIWWSSLLLFSFKNGYWFSKIHIKTNGNSEKKWNLIVIENHNHLGMSAQMMIIMMDNNKVCQSQILLGSNMNLYCDNQYSN